MPARRRMAALAVLSALLPGVSAARSEAELRACLRANAVAGAVSQDIAISQADAAGTIKRLNGRWHWQRRGDGQQAVLKLTAPADLDGAAYLFIHADGEEQFWLYLPSVGKVRKVTGATIAQSLFGRGLSAFDLKFLFSGLGGGAFSRIGSETVGGRPGERWRYRPPSAPDILYDRADLVIDDRWCLPVKAELFGGVPWKLLEVDPASVTLHDGRWRAGRVLLTDLRAGTRSEIRLGVEQTAASLPAALFDPRRFFRAP